MYIYAYVCISYIYIEHLQKHQQHGSVDGRQIQRDQFDHLYPSLPPPSPPLLSLPPPLSFKVRRTKKVTYTYIYYLCVCVYTGMATRWAM